MSRWRKGGSNRPRQSVLRVLNQKSRGRAYIPVDLVYQAVGWGYQESQLASVLVELEAEGTIELAGARRKVGDLIPRYIGVRLKRPR